MPVETQASMPVGMYTLIGAVIAAFIAAIVAIIVALINSSKSNKKSLTEFRREYYFSQLQKLYLPVYAIIAQSEYLRYKGIIETDVDFMHVPFIELSGTIQRFKVENGNFSKTEEKVINDITLRNKEELIKTILDNKEYASQKLLKIAIAYRYEFEYYLNESLTEEKIRDHQEYELLLLYELVVTIVKETNELLNVCGFDYTVVENDHGTIDYDIFMNPDEFKKLRGNEDLSTR